MNSMYTLGYEDGKKLKERAYELGPVGVVGIASYDYNQGFAAANRDRIWANNGRSPVESNG